MSHSIIVLFLAAALFFSHAQAQTAKEIMIKADNAKEPADVTSEMTMKLVNKKGKEKVRKFKIIRMGEERQIMWFLEPADVKGTSFLKIENKTGFDDMRLYLPAFKKVRRIASSAKSESFMGSDFTYEDMTTRKINEYDYKLLADSVIDGNECFCVESTPKKGADTDYGRILSWIWKAEDMIVHETMYDKKGRLLKIKHLGEFKDIKGYKVFHRISIENVQKRHSTVLIMEDVKLDTGVKPGLFHERYLTKMP